MNLNELCKNASNAKIEVGMLDANRKNQVLSTAADLLVANTDKIIAANHIDVSNAIAKQMPAGLLDRLTLNSNRISDMADGLRQIVKLEDPIGEVLSMKKRPNGLVIGKKRVPMGVVGIIYEARPNVTSDAFGLCFKTGNCVILKGGSDAICSNEAIVQVLKEALRNCEVTEYALNLITDPSREVTSMFMKMNQYVDVLIPRGGKGLIQTVVNESTIPVIETGTGNCHIYVDKDADLEMAQSIVRNAKTQRIGVCNAAESLVVHEAVAKEFLPMLYASLEDKQVELRVDEKASSIFGPEKALVKKACEEDWGMEYLDYIMSVKVVSSIEEAIAHINQYNTGHSEAIITNNYQNAQMFLDQIDAACVYVNASTRFTDGNEFGFGAEIGISTQKLHARGPMGLDALTSTKYIIYGNGQIRE